MLSRFSFKLVIAMLSLSIVSCNKNHSSTKQDKLNINCKLFNNELDRLDSRYDIQSISCVLLKNKTIFFEKFFSSDDKDDRPLNYNSEVTINNICLVLNSLETLNIIDSRNDLKYSLLDNCSINNELSLYTIQDLLYATPESILSSIDQNDSINSIISEFLESQNAKRIFVNKDKLKLKVLIKKLSGRDSFNFESQYLNGKIADPFFDLMKYYMGYRVQTVGEKSVLWNYSKIDGRIAILIKIYPENITLITFTESNNINGPTDYNEENILRSPIALALIKAFVFPEIIDNANKTDYKTIEQYNNSQKEIIYFDLLSKINSCDDKKESEKLNILFDSIFNDVIPVDYKTRKSIASISNATDNYIGCKRFELTDTLETRLFAIGEGIELKNFYYDDWENDMVSIFFDLNNNKEDNFDIYDFDRKYCFCWKQDNIFGTFISKEKIEFAQSDPSLNEYFMEYKFPWKTLGLESPIAGKKIGFDIEINDNDGDRFNGSISLSSPPDAASKSTKDYISISLFSGNKILSNEVIAKHCSHPILIDGKEDEIWQSEKEYPLKYEFRNNNKIDLSGSYKVLANEIFLYVFVKIQDDYKNLPYSINAMRDFGWIESNNGEIIWEMSNTNVHSYNKCEHLKYVDTCLILNPGYYNLYYKSDYGHSYGSFYCNDPGIYFYGISLFNNTEFN